ncbi:MAG: hypothetical protein DRP46_10575 [Candidatus Zixiibacteriota bacterium]|nr:MAG: hypothetical protein DRP46_10575 [candidate division Zixibacteria bacterium]
MARQLRYRELKLEDILLRFVMVVYRAKKKSIFKWILAAILFISALCVTFNDVYGAVSFF